jgi:large subunit ribosomal protein L29
MKADAFRDLSTEELNSRARELREQMMKLRFQKSTGQIENPQILSSMRRDLARAMTILREREIKRANAGAAETDAGGGDS